MIISASRRTDIPAFYSRWFINRVREGYCYVPNPFNPKNIYRVSLTPEDVDVIVFWSKNPRPLIEHLSELNDRGYRYYFLYTLNHYDAQLEPNVPDIEARIKIFQELSLKLGSQKVIWRYDPIIISNHNSVEFHENAFRRIATALSGYTRRIITSPVLYYKKTDRRLAKLERIGFTFDREAINKSDIVSLLTCIKTVGERFDMEIQTCAVERDFSSIGVNHGSCIDGRLIHEIWGIDTEIKKDPGQRDACLCVVSKDIGMTDTCLHGCLYCYSTRDNYSARNRHAEHDPDSPILWGEVPKENNTQLKLL